MRKILTSALLALLLCASAAHAASRTEWTAGNGPGLTWTSGFGSGDMTSMPTADAVLSSATGIANGTNLDIYADISVEITISSTTPAAGSYIAIYEALLQEDGSTYGDGSFAAGTQKALVPPYPPVCVIPLQSTNATTLLAGSCTGVLLAPGTFNWVILNETGITWSSTAANNAMKFRTYNVNLNN
jgi:hypothetical protein